ncbi:MAG: high-potential iron-sulfur protein [Betaproteobacteria bacterium]|nr:high-potential iron-sulfur protein [Betaproteobacteria bacterium]
MSIKDEKISRRTFLKGSAMLASIGVVAATGALSRSAYAGVPKAAMQYQDKPKNGQHCSNCIQFIPGASAKAAGKCKLVDGAISPNGWCAAYSAK